MKDVILTGIRANNDLHIGNYFGAMLPMVDMARHRANEYTVNLMLADLHSFVTPIDHSELQTQIQHTLCVYAAAGMPLDIDNVRIFRQSYVPAHSELAWILNCFTGMGQMGRMTQYKDKSAKLGDDQLNVGLFDYPVLMAADILLYGTSYVPVGEDQTQHLEFTRDIAERMNSKFASALSDGGGELFVVPEPVVKQHEFFGQGGDGKEGNHQGLRIKDLLDPSKKMSKSDESGAGVIFLSDKPEEARKKIMRATTDSLASVNYDKQGQQGISNLIDILALLRQTTPVAVETEYKGMSSYGDFKAVVANEMAAFLEKFRTNFAGVDMETVQSKLETSEAAMNIQANATLLRVQKAVGLRV